MKTDMHVFFEDYKRFKFDVNRLKKWVLCVAEEQSKPVKSLNVIFCSDQALLEYNLEYLNHDTLTDIITFYHHEDGDPIEGELFISMDRVRENAGTLNIPWTEELDRVLIHGVLHLMGYHDKTEEEQIAMRTLEDYCLTLRD